MKLYAVGRYFIPQKVATLFRRKEKEIFYCLQMWVFAHRVGKGLYDRTNNGVERMNRTFKYTFLQKRRNNTLSTLIRILVECFVPVQLSK